MKGPMNSPNSIMSYPWDATLSDHMGPLLAEIMPLAVLNPYIAGNTWVCTQHYDYWWPGAKAYKVI